MKSNHSSGTYHASPALWKDLLEIGMREDGFVWDWTTRGALMEKSPDASARARIMAKADGVWAAEGLATALEGYSLSLGQPLKIKSWVRDGDRFTRGTKLLEWSGAASLILAAERPFLNLAGYAGGVATATCRLVDRVTEAWRKQKASGTEPRVTATRKTLPLYRDIAIHGVTCGGGWSHRVNLAGGVLIKENHIAVAGGIAKAVAGARACAPHGLKIEVEVRSLGELEKALSSRVDAVLLDNFSPGEVRKAVALVTRMHRKSAGTPVVEVSGGLSEATIGDYVLPGVSVLSCGGLTHSARSLDLSLLID